MRSDDRLTLASLIATILATLTLLPLTQDRGFLVPAFITALAVAGTGVLLRRNRLTNEAVVLVGQVVVLLIILVLYAGMMPAVSDNPFANFAGQYGAAVDHLRSQAAPMEVNRPIRLLFTTAVGVIMIMTDLLVTGLRRHVWGIAPPLTLFLVPAMSLSDDVSVIGGLLVAVGYIGILLAEGLNRAGRWTRGVEVVEDEPRRSPSAVLWGSALLITIPAIALALVGWMAVPTTSVLDTGLGSGRGKDGPLQLSDPTLDLRRQLTRPDDLTILTYTTDRPTGSYLRLASLPKFDNRGWQNAPIDVLEGQPGPIPGLATDPNTRRRTTINIGDFNSEYLPLPYAPRNVQVPGDWGYDGQSLVYLSTGDNRTEATRGLKYSVDSVDIEPDGNALSTAAAGKPSDNDLTAEVPGDVPQEVIDLAFEITKDYRTPALKAAAIQSYLRSDEFTYSTEPGPGSGYEALTNFLFKDKTGYCEQYAGAMALMTRIIGIPTRVSVGFLPGEQVNGERWEVSTHDLHAWPELYFEGQGWVRWEPTPAGPTAVAPPWTVAREGGTGESQPPSASASETVEEPTGDPSPSAASSTASPSAAPQGSGQSGWGNTLPVVLAIIGGALVLALASLPALVRAARRRSRLHGRGPMKDQVEGLWTELRDTSYDLGRRWPEGSPRAIGRQIASSLETAEVSQMAQLSRTVERARYAPAFNRAEELEGLPALTQSLRKGMGRSTSRGRRVLSVIAPRSLWVRFRQRFQGRRGH
ncbi:MAG: DUF3488 and transglutaminase-like domain-containing protein [Propionibacteriales bacterium]|nr:DUF3488 and transglutaminase-like domain-containing protein [Propionibacteriales bacterium]